MSLCKIETYEELLEEIKKCIDQECGFCCVQMTINNDLYECNQCQKYCHQSCLTKWINAIKKNQKHDKNCIYCHSCSYF